MRRVVVTGVGAVTPCGNTMAATWASLVEGRSGITPIAHFDTTGLAAAFAGQVRGFSPSEWMDVKEARRTGRFIHFAVAAAQMAVDDAAGVMTGIDPRRVSTFIGVGMSGLEEVATVTEILAAGKKVSPFFIPAAIANLAAGQVAMRFDARGKSFCPTSACTSGAHGVGEGFDDVRLGRSDVALAGGAEAGITRVALGGFTGMRALAENDDPLRASRPFDKDRNGFVLSEGAAILVLEERERALKRGATIYAEMVGYGATTDAYHYASPAPEGRGLAEAMRLALDDAKLSPESIDYVNAHATSTNAGDIAEAQAIQRVFADDPKRIWTSSTKSMTGHLVGASGALEAGIAVYTLRHGVVPPTINLDAVDPEIPSLDFVPKVAREKKLRAVISNSTGFGGHNAALVFSR